MIWGSEEREGMKMSEKKQKDKNEILWRRYGWGNEVNTFHDENLTEKASQGSAWHKKEEAQSIWDAENEEEI